MAERSGQRTAEREQRAQEAAKHLGLMKGAFAKEAQASADGAIIYEEGVGRELPLPEAKAEATATRVVTSFVPEAIWRDGEGKVCVVDPASFTRPGGAYEDGAFGCGRLGYDPAQVIGLFQEWFAEHPGVIPQVVFAVPRAYVDAFREAFDPVVEEAVVETAVDEDEDAEEDWRSVELPEGVTLR